MRRILAAAVASLVGLIIGGGGIPSTARAHADEVQGHQGGGGYTPPPVAWGDCTRLILVMRKAECGFVVVPLDYARPTRTKIKIAVSRIKHKNADYQGVMLVNPGGPGGSGLTLATLGESVPGGVGGDYDWIGFDPRGVGSSQPALTCDTVYFGFNRPSYVPATRELEKAWLTKAGNYAKACDRAGGRLLDHLRTTDTVADMESIRKALGAPQINYYGFSYGTYLGQVYATLHPGKVRRMVLDGNVNPARIWYGANLDQDVQFDRNLDVYFGWIAKYDAVYHLGTTGGAVKTRYYASLRQLRTEPAGGRIGPDEWNDIFVSAGYFVNGWKSVAQAFSAWANDRNAAPLQAMYGAPGAPGADNTYAVYLAVQCTDVQWPRTWDKWRSDTWLMHPFHPFLAWNNAWYNAPCRKWGGKAGRPVPVNGAKAPPIMLISETYDAATPFAGSLEVRKRFPRAVLVEGVGGTTHAGSLGGVACTDNTVAAYLDTGALPARMPGNRSDKRCAPVPQPNPTAAAGQPLAATVGSRAALPRLITVG